MRGTVFALLHMVGFAHHRDVQAPQTTGGISPLIRLIRRVLPHAPDKHQPHQPVIARKTRRIIVRTARSRAVAIMRAAERDCEPRINHVSFGADNVSRRPWSESMMVGVDGGSIASPRPMSASRNTYPRNLLVIKRLCTIPVFCSDHTQAPLTALCPLPACHGYIDILRLK
jgi:hypothetical protein